MISLITITAAFVTVLQASSPAPPAADVVARAQGALASMAAGQFAALEEQFTAEMKAAMPSARLAATWMAIQAQAGVFKDCARDPRVVAIADRQMVITPCEFERASLDVQLAFDSAGRISGLVFRPSAPAAAAYAPPSYANPSSYAETTTTFGSGEWALPATRTVPVGAGPFPAVVLVHGSGPGDRDATVGANKPFADLATGLASRGIAVLRYDKRTRVFGAKMAALSGMTVKQEVIDDVLEAVKALRAQPRIDGARVFVLGHSLGGMLAPRIGVADPSIAGLIVMAGAARPLEQAIAAQTRYLAEADGTISAQEQQAIDRAAALVDTIRALKPEDGAGGAMISGAPASYWLDLRGYDPPSAARDVKAPMLILQGERDYQVTTEELARWREALGSRPDVTFHSYPALNHLFIAGSGPSLPAEYNVAGHVAEEVVRDIAAWIRAAR